jgi:hypothetical protein
MQFVMLQIQHCNTESATFVIKKLNLLVKCVSHIQYYLLENIYCIEEKKIGNLLCGGKKGLHCCLMIQGSRVVLILVFCF